MADRRILEGNVESPSHAVKSVEPALRAGGGNQEDAAKAFADDIEPQEPFRVVRERQVRMRVAGVQQGQE